MPVFSGLGEALDAILEPTEPDQLPAAASLQRLWETLQLSDDLVSELVHFRLVCSGGQMRVDRRALEELEAHSSFVSLPFRSLVLQEF